MSELIFRIPGRDGIRVPVRQVLMAGFAGRHRSDVEAHIAEMQELGVAPPETAPVFYPVMGCLLSQSGRIEVATPDTRPEVEFVLFQVGGQWFVTVGNDQYDLPAERASWAVRSKNLCQKAVAATAWPLAEVAGHWDRLRLTLSSGDDILQKDSVATLHEPMALRRAAMEEGGFRDEGGILFSGTISGFQGFRAGLTAFTIALSDPVLGRSIVCGFEVVDLTAKGAGPVRTSGSVDSEPPARSP